MKPWPRALQVFDNFFHIAWWTFAMLGAFAVPEARYGELRGLIAVGLFLGALTSPVVVRRLRPALQRRWPWAFDDGSGQSGSRDR